MDGDMMGDVHKYIATCHADISPRGHGRAVEEPLERERAAERKKEVKNGGIL